MCDRDYAIIGAVLAKCGTGKNAVPIHLCEYHLLNKGRQALAKDGIRFGDPLNDLPHDAMHSDQDWTNFEYPVQGETQLVNANKWVTHWAKRIRARRPAEHRFPRSTRTAPSRCTSPVSALSWIDGPGPSATGSG